MMTRAGCVLLVATSFAALSATVALTLARPQEVRTPAVATPRSDTEGLTPVLSEEELGRKKTKKKGNSTEAIGEILTTVIDGIVGEDEDAGFGSELGEDLFTVITSLTKLGEKKKKKDKYESDSRDAPEDPAANTGCEDCGEFDASRTFAPMRSLRSPREVGAVVEGRKRQVRRLLVRYVVLLKVFALGIILPGAVLLALLQSWKAVTVSLLALLLATVVGIRGLVSSAGKGQAEVIHAGPSSHYWRRVSQESQDNDRIAYNAYSPY